MNHVVSTIENIVYFLTNTYRLFYFFNHRNFSIVVSAVGASLSFGNGSFGNVLVGPILGAIAVIVVVSVPATVKFDNFFLRTDLKDHPFYFDKAGWILVVFGVILLLIQIRNLAFALAPNKEALRENRALILFDRTLGSNRLRAFRGKQAGIFKLNEMIRNAYNLHTLDEQELEREALTTGSLKGPKRNKTSTKEIALQKYSDLLDDTEEVGGTIWGWKEYCSGRLATTEGVWIPSRLVAGNVILFFTTFIVVILSYFFLLHEAGEIEDAKVAFQDKGFGNCNSTFNA